MRQSVGTVGSLVPYPYLLVSHYPFPEHNLVFLPDLELPQKLPKKFAVNVVIGAADVEEYCVHTLLVYPMLGQGFQSKQSGILCAATWPKPVTIFNHVISHPEVQAWRDISFNELYDWGGYYNWSILLEIGDFGEDFVETDKSRFMVSERVFSIPVAMIEEGLGKEDLLGADCTELIDLFLEVVFTVLVVHDLEPLLRYSV